MSEKTAADKKIAAIKKSKGRGAVTFLSLLIFLFLLYGKNAKKPVKCVYEKILLFECIAFCFLF